MYNTQSSSGASTSNTASAASSAARTPTGTPGSSSQRSTALLPKRNTPAPKSYREDSPEIEVVSEKKSTNSSPAIVRKELPKKNTLPNPTANCTALLNILARPRNMHPVAIAVRDRKELDVMVKSSLVKTQQGFTEWLFGLRLVKDKLLCNKHPNSTAIKLGLYPCSVLPASGGYVWMVDCCAGGRKYVSIYTGSIFALSLKEGISATSVLKLIYHWSCQTTITNVENWVKVRKKRGFV